MKFILILMIFISTMQIYAKDTHKNLKVVEVPQLQKKVIEFFDTEKTPDQQEIFRLQVLVSELQASNRETRRKYHIEKMKRQDLEKMTVHHYNEIKTYTREEVRGYLDQNSSELAFDGMLYMVAEERFLLSLDSIDDIKWMLDVMIRMNMEKITNFSGTDITYNKKIDEIIKDYQSYYESQHQSVEPESQHQLVEPESQHQLVEPESQ